MVNASDVQAAFRPFRAGRQQRAIEAAVQEPWEPRTSVPSSVIVHFGTGPEILHMYTQAQVRAHENQLARWHSTQAERTAAHDQELRLIIDSFGSQRPTGTAVAHQLNPTQTFDQVFLQELGPTDPFVASLSGVALPTPTPTDTVNVRGLAASSATFKAQTQTPTVGKYTLLLWRSVSLYVSTQHQ